MRVTVLDAPDVAHSTAMSCQPDRQAHTAGTSDEDGVDVFDAASASGSSAASSEDSVGEAGAASDSSAEWVMANGAVLPAPGARRGGVDASTAERGTGRKSKQRRGGGDDYDEDVFAPAEDYADALATDAPVANGGRGREALRPSARGGRAASGGPAAGVQRPRGGKRGKRAQSAAARHL